MFVNRLLLAAAIVIGLSGAARQVGAAPLSTMFDRIEDDDASDRAMRLRLIGEFQSGRHLMGLYDFAEIRSPESFERMGKIAASATLDPEVTQAALNALGEVKHEGAVAPLVDIAQDGTLPEATRISACRNLGKHIKRGVQPAAEGLVRVERNPATPDAVKKAAQGELKGSSRLRAAAVKAIAEPGTDGRPDAEGATGNLASLDSRLSPEDSERMEQSRQARMANLELTNGPAAKAQLAKIRKMEPFDLALADFTFYCEGAGLLPILQSQLFGPEAVLTTGRNLAAIRYEEREVKSIDGEVTERLLERSVEPKELNPWLRHKDYWSEVEKAHQTLELLTDDGLYAVKQAYIDQARKRKK